MSLLSNSTLIVVAARRGDPASLAVGQLPDADRVIAVDSGLHLALALGLQVDLLIGDLDSVGADVLQQARAAGLPIQLHPRDKEHTDLALALREAVAGGAETITVVGGAGGRLDHGIANLHALADDHLAQAQVRALLGGARIHVVRDRATELHGAPGDLVSLICVGPDATVRTSGLRWDLHDEALGPTSTRGVSNELTAATATVHASHGVVLAIQPAHDEALEI